MSRFRFLARKLGRAEKPIEPATASDNPLELDEDLFSTLGTQLGGENETLRNLLLDAHNKINELDGIKATIGRLVDPVSKTLRDLEAAQDQLRTVEAAKAELTAEVAVQRGKAADLEKRVAQQTGECTALLGENRRLTERLTAAQMHTAALEKVVTEAHDLLLARAEQNREHNRCNGELATERDALQARLTDLQAEPLKRESEFKEVDHVRMSYAERNAALARAFTAKEAVLALAEQADAALNERIGALETALAPGHRRRSPAPGSHRTWRAALPHHALRQLVHSTASACSFP